MQTNFYREETVEILPKQLKEIIFGVGESPNHFFVNNLSNTKLLCGITNIPSEDFYEAAVEAGGSKMVARRDGTTRFYIYNASNTNVASILLTSFNEVFSPTTLAMGNLGLSVDMSGVTIEGGGTINEMNCSLPPGANTIGNVGLAAGINHIGNVGVDALPQVYENAAVAINNCIAGIKAAVDELKVLTNDIKTLQGASNEIWTSNKITQLMSAVNNIAAVAGGKEFTGTLETLSGTIDSLLYINFSDENSYVNYVNYIRCKSGGLSVYINGSDCAIVLQEGDSISDINGMIQSIRFVAEDVTADYEMLYSYVTIE